MQVRIESQDEEIRIHRPAGKEPVMTVRPGLMPATALGALAAVLAGLGVYEWLEGIEGVQQGAFPYPLDGAVQLIPKR